MSEMRKLINLMEGVEDVPGIGNQAPQLSNRKCIVFLKVKGDRFGPADYKEIKSFDDIESAKNYIKTLPVPKNSMQSYVIRYSRPNVYEKFVLDEKSKSEKQARFMAAAAHDPKFAKKAGIEQGVAKEFNKADTGTELLSKANKKTNEGIVDFDDIDDDGYSDNSYGLTTGNRISHRPDNPSYKHIKDGSRQAVINRKGEQLLPGQQVRYSDGSSVGTTVYKVIDVGWSSFTGNANIYIEDPKGNKHVSDPWYYLIVKDTTNTEMSEALPPKAMSMLRTAKDKIAKDNQLAPVVKEPEAFYSTSSPEDWLSNIAKKSGKEIPPELLSPPEDDNEPKYPKLKAKLDTLNQLLPIKKQIETLASRAQKWGPLPKGIESDLDDSHIRSDDYETQLEHAKVLLARLEQYMSMKKSLYKKTNETAHVDTCKQSNPAAARDACAMDEGRTVPLSKRDAGKLAKRLQDERWQRMRDNDERERQSQQQTQPKPEPKESCIEEFHEYEEGIELGDNTLGDLGHFIVDQRNGKVLAGPFGNYEGATSAADTFQWYDPRIHFIEVGSEDEDGFFVDEAGNRGVMEEEFNNGYGSEKYASGNDFFPNGADGPVVKKVGPSGARQGDNPEQKKMQVEETHKELVYAYREYLKESAKK